MKNKFNIIKNAEIEDVLEKTKRIYFTGDLKLPQEIEHIFSKEVEIGITHLEAGSYEAPHYHTEQNEFCFVMEGKIEYILTKAKKSYFFEKGDFFHIEPFTTYEQRVHEGSCQVFFVKHPSVNDKIIPHSECDAP